MAVGPFASEIDELTKIDYLLDEVARSVERGEVPRSVYDALAPRYLFRRAELVAIITGTATPGVAIPSSADSADAYEAAWAAEEAAARTRPARARREHKPVRWTTVLLFLGAFLVVVSSAIFSVAVWDLLGVLGKFAFLATLTGLFYGAGWYAKARLKLRTGSSALVGVASAMLLFDGWILISGYSLSGALPWAALLGVCSLAYWATEVWLADRFSGVIGAAAQMGWWWLLGAGLGLPVAARLAGMAVVVLAWQFASEHGRDTAVGSLARVLEWAALAASLALAAGSLADLALVRSAGPLEVAYAGVVAAAASAVWWRTRLLPARARRIASPLVQAPVLAAAWMAAAVGEASWWVVALLAVVAAADDAFGFVRGEVGFVALGLVAELSLVLHACVVLDVSAETTVLVVAVLGAVWSAAARLIDRYAPEDAESGFWPLASRLCEAAAIALLVAASFTTPIATRRFALLGPSLTWSQAAVSLGVLAAWWASATVRRNPFVSYAGSVWSFYALASLESWLLPDLVPAAYATGLAVLGGVWLASGTTLEPRLGKVFAEATRVSARVATALVWFVGLAWSLAEHPEATGIACALAVVTAAVFALDAWIGGWSLAAAPAIVALVAAKALGGAWLGRMLGAHSYDVWAAVTGATAAAVFAGIALAWRSARALARKSAVLAAAVSASALVGVAGSQWWQALVAALAALAWASAAVVSTQWLAAASGVAAFGAMLLALNAAGAGPWTVLACVCALAYALAAAGFTRAFGPGGAHRKAGVALAGTGVAAVGGYAALSFAQAGPGAGVVTVAQPQVLPVSLLALAVLVLVTGIRWRVDAAYYVAGIAGVFAVWGEAGILSSQPFAMAYALPLALYLAGCGYLNRWLSPDGGSNPVVLDAAAVLVGLGYPLLAALQAVGTRALYESLALVAVALAAIGLGIVLKVRWYLFGGTAALAAVAVYRSLSALAEFWWVVLGMIGLAMLVIALTWERQRHLVGDARERLRRSFEGWR